MRRNVAGGFKFITLKKVFESFVFNGLQILVPCRVNRIASLDLSGVV